MTEIVKQAEDLGYIVKRWNDLYILKTTDKVSVHTQNDVDLKGMIYRDVDGQSIMVASGCKVPLEDDPFDAELKYSTPAYDGVLFRMYWHEDAWRVSTTGCVSPKVRWGCPRTFEDLFNDADAQYDTDFMDKECCYYAVLEHEDFVNVVKHVGVRLTLTRVTRMTSAGVQDEPFHCHKGAFANTDPPFMVSNLEHDASVSDPAPVQRGQVGFIRHYADGTVYRDNSPQFKRAVAIRPNYPTEKERWLHLHLNNPDSAKEYTAFFPWTADAHQEYTQQLIRVCKQVNADYLAKCAGEYVRYPGRHVRFMKELIAELPDDGTGDTVVFLMSQDMRRILFMMEGQEEKTERNTEIESQS